MKNSFNAFTCSISANLSNLPIIVLSFYNASSLKSPCISSVFLIFSDVFIWSSISIPIFFRNSLNILSFTLFYSPMAIFFYWFVAFIRAISWFESTSLSYRESKKSLFAFSKLLNVWTKRSTFSLNWSNSLLWSSKRAFLVVWYSNNLTWVCKS